MISQRKLVRVINASPLKQWEIANRAGVSKQTISHLVNGRSDVTERVLVRIAQALGVRDEEIREDFTPDPATITSRRALDLALQPNSRRAKRFRDAIEMMWNATFRTIDFEQQCCEEFDITDEQNKAADDTIASTPTTQPENS